MKNSLDQISLYFNEKKQELSNAMPSQTNRDLNIDDFFLSVDYTSSCIGRQYLYFSLNQDQSSGIDKHEDLINQIASNQQLKGRLTAILEKLNHPDAYSITSILTKPIEYCSKIEMRLISICRFLPFLFVSLLLITNQLTFLFFTFLAVIANFILHYKNKTKIQQYCFSIPQLVLLLKQAEKLEKEEALSSVVNAETRQALQEMKATRKNLSQFRISIRLENDIAILAYMLSELFQIFFLLEAYMINKSLKLLQEKVSKAEQIFQFVGFVDMLCSVAMLRLDLPNYCLPTNSKNSEHRYAIKDIYHPLIKEPVANDLRIINKSILLTGSNMTGKTSFIRTIGINLLSAKVLHTCFASEFDLSLNFRIASAINTSDDLMKGTSYFLQEVKHIKHLIELGKQEKYLFLLDEIFKGTNTRERIAISKAVLLKLAENNLVFVATHDLELGKMLESSYDSYYFNESIKDEVLFFDYKIKKGIATETNAIKLLELYNYPQDVVREAYISAITPITLP